MSSYSPSDYNLDFHNSRSEREKEESRSAASYFKKVTRIAERVGRYRNLPGGLWLHGRRCCELVSAYASVRQKLRPQLVAALQSVPSENQLFPDLRHALDNLSFAMREGELWVGSCRCGPESTSDHELLWMQKALAWGLSTEPEDTHLHDFLVALCAVSDAIKFVVEKRRANESPLDPPTRQGVLTPPDIFWGELGRRLNEARNEDLEHMSSHLAEIAMKSSGDDLKSGVARLMQAKIADEEKHIAEKKICNHLQLPDGVFARFQDVDSLGNIYPHEHPYYNDSGIRVQKVVWRPGGPDVFAMKEYLSTKAKGYFLQEAPIHLRLHHPNVVQSICVFQDETRSGLLMELMDRNLDDLLQSETALSLTEKVSIMLQIAKGMEYIHSKGVIHRDLKPQNVLVKNPNHGVSTSAAREGQQFKRSLQVKIADFNVSKAKWNSKYSTKHVGTTVYRAPEVLNEDESEYTKSADVYSFAMVCFQILSGKQPFHDSAEQSVYRKLVREGKRPKLSELVKCPPYLKHCIGMWWDQKPDKRTGFTDICRVLRHLYVALINVKLRRDSDVPRGLAFLSKDQATWKTGRKALQANMRSWEARRSKQDWINRGYPCVYTRVNDIPYEMHVMSIVLENAEAMPGCFASFLQSCCLTKCRNQRLGSRFRIHRDREKETRCLTVESVLFLFD